VSLETNTEDLLPVARNLSANFQPQRKNSKDSSIYFSTVRMKKNKNGQNAKNFFLRNSSGRSINNISLHPDTGNNNATTLENNHIQHLDADQSPKNRNNEEAERLAFLQKKLSMHEDDEPIKKVKFPVRWTSPEVLTGAKNVSTQSDIWSFGVLLWELFSWGEKNPYPDIFDNNEVVEKVVNDGYRMPQPLACPDEVYLKIIRQCWAEDPAARPPFVEIHKILEETEEKMKRNTSSSSQSFLVTKL
jgi:hypothetical protein